MIPLVFLVPWLSWMGSNAAAQEIPAPNPCDDLDQVAREFMDLELAGSRWQGGDSPCLARVKTTRLRGGKREGAADPALLDPEYQLPKKRKIEIKTRRLPQDLIEVRIAYLGKKLGKDEQIRDELTLKLQFGRAREEKGCALLHRPPKHFVMREGCSED